MLRSFVHYKRRVKTCLTNNIRPPPPPRPPYFLFLQKEKTHMNLLRKPITTAELMTASCSLAENTLAMSRISSPLTALGTGPTFFDILMAASSLGVNVFGSGLASIAAIFFSRNTLSPLQIVPRAAQCAEQYPQPYALRGSIDRRIDRWIDRRRDGGRGTRRSLSVCFYLSSCITYIHVAQIISAGA